MELNSELADELIHRGFEAPNLDYKLEFDDSTQAWMEIAKDIYGMANYGGGYIVIGVEDGTFTPIGLNDTFHIDTQIWIDRVSKWSSGKVSLSYFEHMVAIKGKKRKFPVLYVHGSIGSLVIPKVDGIYATKSGEKKTAFKQGSIYTRRDTSTVLATGNEFWQLFWSLLRRTAESVGSTGTPLEILSALSRKSEPDVVEETLWFNLFPVVELPDQIYYADTEFRYPMDIYTRIEEKIGSKNYDAPSFLLEDKKIYSFSPFDENNPLTLCIDTKSQRFLSTEERSRISTISTEQWLKDEMSASVRRRISSTTTITTCMT